MSRPRVLPGAQRQKRAGYRIEDAGRIAEQAGARTLAPSHVIPHNMGDDRLRGASRHYSGRLVPGHDLAAIGIGRRRAA